MTQIWAHRGASADAAENTLAAFQLAQKQGADGIELDVMRTKDQVIVVMHDESCRRVTGKDGLVRDMTLQKLQQLDFADHRPGHGRQSILTLDEVLEWSRPGNLTLNIELKNNLTLDSGLEQAVIDRVCAHGLSQRVILSSFNHYSMQKAARIAAEKAPSLCCGILYDCELVDVWEYAKHLGVQAIHPLYVGLQIPGIVDQCQKNGIAVHPWTINNPRHIDMALDIGVDAVITDVPAKAIYIRQQKEAANARKDGL